MKQTFFLAIAGCISLTGCKTTTVASSANTSVTQVVATDTVAAVSTDAPVTKPPLVLTEELAQGKSIYENKCANCHGLYKPEEFTAQDWEPILKRMQRKAELDDATMKLVHDYVIASL